MSGAERFESRDIAPHENSHAARPFVDRGGVRFLFQLIFLFRLTENSMYRVRTARLAALSVTMFGLVFAGCSGPAGPVRIKVKGNVSNKGARLNVPAMVGRVQVTFYPVSEPGAPRQDPQEAAIQPNGDFTVPGTDGKGIVAGKYKIAVRQWEDFPNKDVLAGKFDEKNTKIVKDVTSDEDILIDVAE
ncbi:MAG: hypothetical protein JWN70_4197 [Planctomycetaceae bacterium]|nr:hypothetical protein [Planctomycetaceae bacterium]